eukprot:SAG25_NODE_2297_length_1743_cov_1.347932_2_plen_107_part_00
MLFECLDAEFRLRDGSYMTFPLVLNATRERFALVLAGCTEHESLAALRQRAIGAFHAPPLPSAPASALQQHVDQAVTAAIHYGVASVAPCNPVVFGWDSPMRHLFL